MNDNDIVLQYSISNIVNQRIRKCIIMPLDYLWMQAVSIKSAVGRFLSLIIPPVAGDHDRREVRGDGTATVRVQPAGAAGQVVGPRRGGHLQLRTEDRRLSHQTCQSPLGCGIRRGQNTQRMSS